MNKRGQVAIFIILGIVVVVGILVSVFWVRPTYFFRDDGGLNFEECVEDAVEQAVVELGGKAGLIDPKFTYSYDGEELTYLCYSNEYYETCSVQVPFLKNVFDEQIEVLIRDRIDLCYANSVDDLRGEGYSVVEGVLVYDVLIEPSVVRVEIEAPTVVGGSSFARFNVRVNSPIYEMVMIATSILQFEARYGDSDVDSMRIYYPDYFIEKIKRGDGTTVYILENMIYGNKFKFASRSLVWPAGYVV